MVGKSDPIVIVDKTEVKSGVTTRVGMTECIKETLNPEFTKKIDFEYIFEEKQHLRITVLDVDDQSNIPTEYTPHVSKDREFTFFVLTCLSNADGECRFAWIR